MKQIALSDKNGIGKFVLIDDKDFDWLNQWKWKYHKTGYAVRNQSVFCGDRCEKCGRQKYKSKFIRMHRIILNTPDKLFTDHINGNKLDNQRKNLRVCSHLENMRNKKRQQNNTSGYKGVYWSKQKNKWHTRIKLNGKNKNLGFFDNKHLAALMYDFWATILFGEFAKTNFKVLTKKE